MNSKDFSKLTDEELLKAEENSKPKPIFDAFFIGFMVGILIFGAVAQAWGFAMLIPLFLIYLFLKKPKQYKALQDELKKRGLNPHYALEIILLYNRCPKFATSDFM